MHAPTIALALLGLGTALASAQPGRIAATRLSADDFEQREQGEQELRESEGVTVDGLLGLLAETPLSPESHRRVARAAFELFRSTPRAGMGVEFDIPNTQSRGVPIKRPIPNFPAFELLQPGDVILSVDGAALTNSEHLGAIIVSHDPGDVLEIELERSGETLVLDVPLGSFSALGQRSRVDIGRLDAAFAQRRMRLGVDDRLVAGELGSNLTLDDWAAAELGLQDGIDPDATPSSRRAGSDALDFVRGGRPRSATAPGTARDPRNTAISSTSAMASRNARVLARRLSELARQRVRLRVRLEQGNEPEAELEKVRVVLAELDERIEELTLQIGSPNPTTRP